MKKRWSVMILLSALLVMSLVLSGCGKQENAASQTQESQETAESAATQEEVSGAETAEAAPEETEESPETSEESAPCTVMINGKYYSQGIKKLTLETLNETDIENLALFPELTELTLTNMQLPYEAVMSLKETCPDMELHYAFDLSLAGLPEIKVDETTESLDVSNMEVTSAEAMTNYMRLLPSLTELVMCDCGLSNEEMAAMREALPDTKVIWMLHLQDYSFRTDVIAYSTLVMWTPVPHPITSEDAEQFKYCTDLMALDLGHQAISDLSWLQYLPELRLLILADNKVTDITPIGTLTELRFVELFGNYGIQTWDPLANCTKLEDINIGFVDGPKDFSFLEPLTNLQHFWAIGCVYTGAQDQQIRSLIPAGCEYRWDSKKPEEAQEPTGSGWRETNAFWAQYYMFRGNYLDERFY